MKNVGRNVWMMEIKMSDPHGIKIRITEVGPRDGLQNEPNTVPTDHKIALINALSAAGLPEIETSSFVSPKWVPQLADAEDVFTGITRRPGTVYSALVPNIRGLERAQSVGAMKIALFTAVSESFCNQNINATFEESIERFVPVVEHAASAHIPVRAYLSCIVKCPYEGFIEPVAVRTAIERLLQLGDIEIDLGETLGVATPEQIEAVLEATARVLPLSETTLHLHDTNGRALESVDVAVGMGVRSFDSACGGLGGCPFAEGAKGNLATERLVAHCETSGWATGVDPVALAKAASLL